MDEEVKRLKIIAESACKALGKLTARERDKGPNPEWIHDYNDLRKRVVEKFPKLEGDLPEITRPDYSSFGFPSDLTPLTCSYSQLLAYHERIVAFLQSC